MKIKSATFINYFSQCEGKKQFCTKEEADKIVDIYRIEHPNVKKCIESYRCDHCNWFHVGHKPKHGGYK